MNSFKIEKNNYLNNEIYAYYHAEYRRGKYREQGSIEELLTSLKNDIKPVKTEVLNQKVKQLENILLEDLMNIYNELNSKYNNLIVCVVPRAKVERYYKPDQLLFKKTVVEVINNLQNHLGGFYKNGADYIIRHTNTKTTHLKIGGGDGKSPYPGITRDTCHISNEINNKNILLIDDIYTKSINIIEDAIQSLFDNGANNVIFYCVGKTVMNK